MAAYTVEPGDSPHVYSDGTDIRVLSTSDTEPSDPTLTALAALNATAGLLEQTGADTFTKRAIGVGASSSVPTRADADTRYVLSGPQAAVAKTANYTLQASDHGKTFTNEGAGAQVVFQLPSWTAGFQATFVVYETQNVRVFDAASSNIFKGSASADRWNSNTPMTSITVEATATDYWTVTSVVNDVDWT